MTTPPAPRPPAPRPTVRSRLHAAALRLAREHTTTGRLSAAVALGALVGTSPFFGFHALIGAALARLLRLNQVAVLAGEQVSLPLFAPLLAFASVQSGHRLRTGAWLALDPSHLDLAGAAAFFGDWLLGALLTGSALGLLLGAVVWLTLRTLRREWPGASPTPSPVATPAVPWTGRSRGSSFGWALVIQTARLLGRRGAYFLLWFAVPYFLIVSGEGRRHSRAWLQRVLGPRPWHRRQLDLWRHFHAFGRSMVDGLLAMLGRQDAFAMTSDGFEHIAQAQAAGEGALLLSAHVGSRAMAGETLGELALDIVAYEGEAEGIRRVLDRHRKVKPPGLIVVNDGPAAAVSILSALKRGRLVAILADRTRGGETFAIDFLGQPAHFPAGPFLVAAVSGAPVIFTFAPKLAPDRQHFYARPPRRLPHVARSDRRPAALALAREYVAELEAFVRAYPYQWYNFYDFWAPPADAETRVPAPPRADPQAPTAR